MMFRLEYFGATATGYPTILEEIDLPASDVVEALRDAESREWPRKAIGVRLLDLDGLEIRSWLKADG